jgi:hypothetical protein
MAHYHLGTALARLGRRKLAIAALQTSVAMAPRMTAARDLLNALQPDPQTKPAV